MDVTRREDRYMQQGDQLDQLWYTWSKNGLDSMAMGYRVRAASGELRQTQSMRYRVLDRFLRYEPPQGVNINEFDARIAPVSFALLYNGTERLLVRKVFKGRDLAGRNSVFFTHLIAGLPDDFTTRDAIRLWDWPHWATSEDHKAANDTLLDPIPYADLKRDSERAQQAPSLPFSIIRTQLEELLLAILCQSSFPSYLQLVGNANLAAALIYGLTHCLPLTFLGGNFTFTTYESTTNEPIATFVTTVTGAELSHPNYLDVRADNLPPVSPIAREQYKNYVNTAINRLISGNAERFLGFLKKVEGRNCQSADQLLEEFNLVFSQEPLTFRQLKTIITYADEYPDKLNDRLFQQESANLLLTQEAYSNTQGKQAFQSAIERPRSIAARQVLTAYLQGL